jgi:hypothetical protein
MADRKRHAYRVIAVSLYEGEANEADRCTDALKRAGWPKANRSLVVREALLLLQEQLAGKDDERVFRYFVERHARRVGGAAQSQRRPEPWQANPAEGTPKLSLSGDAVSEVPDHPRRRR